jgi:hypothetical protein
VRTRGHPNECAELQLPELEKFSNVDVDLFPFTGNIRVVRSLDPGLDQRAIEAVRQWHFRPGTKDGKPVRVAATVDVNFQLLD